MGKAEIDATTKVKNKEDTNLKKEEDSKRLYKFDNARLILIFLVVFCHFIESIELTTPTAGLDNFYKIIYSFHMPLFIFITGYFSKFKFRKIIFRFAIPYFIFQTLYCLFTKSEIQFATPYWLLWFIFLMPVYYLINLFFNKQNNIEKIIIILISVAVSLVIGNLGEINYTYSLSRLFTFLPYFLLGTFVGNVNIKKNNKKLKEATKQKINKNFLIRKVISLLLVVGSIEFILNSGKISSRRILYGALPYSALNYTTLTRFEIMLVACSWIWFFMEWVPNKKIKFITVLGENTMAIYLIHGFMIIWTKTNLFFNYSLEQNILIAIGLTILIIFTLGNKFTTLIFDDIFCCDAIFKFVKSLDKLRKKRYNRYTCWFEKIN